MTDESRYYSPVRNFGPLHHKTDFSTIKHLFLTKARLSPQTTRIHPKLGSQFEGMPQNLSTEKLARIRAGLEIGTDQKTITRGRQQVTSYKSQAQYRLLWLSQVS